MVDFSGFATHGQARSPSADTTANRDANCSANEIRALGVSSIGLPTSEDAGRQAAGWSFFFGVSGRVAVVDAEIDQDGAAMKN